MLLSAASQDAIGSAATPAAGAASAFLAATAIAFAATPSAGTTALAEQAAAGPATTPEAGNVLASAAAQAAVRATGLAQVIALQTVEPRVSESWIGHRVGASPGRWRYAGHMKRTEGDAPFAHPRFDPSAPSVPNDNPFSMIIGDPETREMIEVVMEEQDIRRIGEALTEEGYAEPTSSADGDSEGLGEEHLVEKNVDNCIPPAVTTNECGANDIAVHRGHARACPRGDL